jgi:two-component system CheB/CheR fusion protein
MGPANDALTYVAVGASAGGLAPLRELFAAGNVDPRLAFIVITHLPAHHVSHLAELLAQAGPLPAVEAKAGQRLEGGHIYVMPPGKMMGLRGGCIFFEAAPPVRPPAPKPIDFFMASLAGTMHERSVGIVLSGTDHDGTVGLKAIKAAGGLTLVQTPLSAEFPSMPQSAINAGTADLVVLPSAMASALSKFLEHGPLDLARPSAQAASVDPTADRASDPTLDPALEANLKEILALVLARTGNDFGLYRSGMLKRRLARRLALLGCEGVPSYVQLLAHSPSEASILSSEFLIGVTDFFRDSKLWPELEQALLPPLLANVQADAPAFRAWTAGCSSGEESYSVAMVLLELLEQQNLTGSVQVFGTDIDHQALSVARQSVYPGSIASTVPAARLAKFFEHRDGQYAVRKRLRNAVTFAPQNLLSDMPFSRLDLICCRNLLMYFEPALQDQAFEVFHFALKPGGLLWLGQAESLGAHSAMFEPVGHSMRLYRRIGGRSRLPRGFVGVKSLGAGAPLLRAQTAKPLPPAEILQAHLLAKTVTVTAAVLMDRQGRALHFHGEMERFMALEGEATLELVRLLRKELRPAMRALLRQAASEAPPALRSVLLPSRHDDAMAMVSLEASALSEPVGRGMLVATFTIAKAGFPPPSAVSLDPAASLFERQMQEHRQELALALEEAERSNEELRIASEDASTLYEEVQSSNEELESSKEELQALNEELSSVNAQLENQIVETAQIADDTRNLLDSTHIATLLLDDEMRIRRFTPYTAHFFSLRPGDEGRRLSDITSRVNDAALFVDAQTVLASSQPAEAEVMASDGTALLRRIQPYLTQSGRAEGVVLTLIDITPLRTASRQVERLGAILNDSNDAVFSHDPKGRIMTWNKGAEHAYGYRREEALSMQVTDLMPPAQHEGARSLIEQALQTGSAGPVEVPRLTHNGTVTTVSVTVSALRDDQGSVYALLSTERDITERLRVESEMRFRRLADDIPALLRVEDASGLAEFVNRACTEFTGRPRQALLGQGWLEFVHPLDRERYLTEHAAAHGRQQPLESDLRLLRHDGVYRWMRSISVPHIDPSGAFSGYVALMLDVEDRKRVESELMAADRRKDEFLAMLAHELRNPLAPIRSAVTILGRSAQPDQRTEWAVGVIDRQAQMLAKLLDGLLDVARISQGKTQLDRVPVELRVVVGKALEISEPLISSRRQRLAIEFLDELLVEGDLVRLTQVFANLLNNASKYTQEEGEIRLAVHAQSQQAVIGIQDNGAGIAQDMLPRVFELFSQADTTLDRAGGGLGLGLTLVRQLVELHGGSVQAQSEGLGAGSTFTVRLPLLQRAAPLTPKEQGTPAQPPAQARRVLVVDDHVDGAQTLASLLEMDGHNVTVVHDGPTAIEVAPRLRPDVVLLDIGLPRMNGYEVARTLRGLSSTSQSTLIAITGYGQPEDVASALAAGFDRHLVKPVDPDALAALVAAAPRLA